jgi:hypothetical protein
MGTKSTNDLLHACLALALIAGTAMHVVLRDYTPLFGEVAFDRIAPPDSILGFQRSSNHIAKVRWVLTGRRSEQGVRLEGVAETVS